MSGQTWAPAPKRGVVPLHPLTFGTILGRAFAVLRHNPKVIFGFAVVTQLIILVLTAAVMVGMFALLYGRLENVTESDPDFEPLMIGTIVGTALIAFGIGLLSVLFTAVLQGIVAADVRSAAIGQKASLRGLWSQVKPAFWRLLGFAALQLLYGFVLASIITGAIVLAVLGGTGGDGGMVALMVVLIILIVLGAIPLSIWLWTKLLLVPSVLVIEHTALRAALVRSWRLTRGRFWVAFGAMFLISMIMGIAAQVVGIPATLIASMFGAVIAPTGANDTSAVVGFVLATVAPQILTLIVQAIALIVQAAGASLIYLDSRFRYEGLDQALIVHVERNDAGWTDTTGTDPYAVDPERAVTSAPPPAQTPEWMLQQQAWQAQQAGYPVQQPYTGQYQGQQPYPAQPQYPTPPYQGQPYQGQPPYQGQQPYPAQPYQRQAQQPAQPEPGGHAQPQQFGGIDQPARPPQAEPPAPPTDSPWAPPSR